MSELKKLLGKRIREIRIAKNLTQEDLSELTDIGTSSISKIESGHFHPTDENLEKIAKALCVEPYKLYMFNHQKNAKDLRQEIQKILNGASDKELQLVYKILDGIFN